MKKIFLTLLVIFLMTGCGGEKESENVNSMKYSRQIIIGMDEFAPFGYTDESGNIVGFDVDMAKEAAKRMGVEPEFKIIDWNEKESELNSGRVDMIWNGLNITGNRDQYMLFSRPYMDNRQILMVKHGNPKGIHALGDLAGKIVAVQVDSTARINLNDDKYLRDSFAELKTCQTVEDGFEALKNGEFDALIIDEIAARYEINRHPGELETVEAMVGPPTHFAIGFKKGNTALRDKVQKVLDEMIKDGTAKKFSLEWFGADLIKSSR